MKNIAGIIAIATLLVIASCKSDKKCEEQAMPTSSVGKSEVKKDFDTITYEHFIIQVPHTAKMVDYLDLTRHPATVLQLNDSINDYFTMVIEEEATSVQNVIQKKADYQKDKDLFYNYARFAEKNIYEKIKDYQLISSNDVLLDSCKAKVYKFYGKDVRPSADKKDKKVYPIFYHVAIVEADKHLYQIVTWTPKEKEADNAPKLQGIIESFEENSVKK